MKSIFKLSLFAAAMTFAASNVAMAATPAQHQNAPKHHKGQKYNKKAKKVKTKAQGDQETADLNARSLQAVQTVNNGGNPAAVQQVVPNPEMQLAPSARVPLSGNQTTQSLNRDSMQDVKKFDSRGRRVITAPGTGNTVAPPPAPGAVNPNNMPPVQ